MRTLAEDIAVIALFPASPVPAAQLDRVVCAASLVDLLLLGRIGVVDHRVRVLDPAPTGDALLDDLIGRIGGTRRLRSASSWVLASGKAHLPVLDRLADAGAVRVTRRAGRLSGTEYDVTDAVGPARLRAGLRAALLAPGGLDPRSAALAAIAVSAGMVGRLLVLDERAEARERVSHALRPAERCAAVEVVLAAVRSNADSDLGWHVDAGDGRSFDGGSAHGDAGGGDGGGGDGGGGD